MTDYQSRTLLSAKTVAVWDVVCPGTCRQRCETECVCSTHLVFPYRGLYVRHVGKVDTIAQADHVIFFNKDEPYQVSHPVEGGDANLSIHVDEEHLLELAPTNYLEKGRAIFNRPLQRIDTITQALAARLRHGLSCGTIDEFEAEARTLSLVRRALRPQKEFRSTIGQRKLVDRTKMTLSADPMRRWTLRQIADEVGVSAVHLTQIFQQVEGLPVYRYQLQLRLTRALDMLRDCEDLTRLALDLGFSSHSHFGAAFKRAYAQTPSDFQRSIRARGS